MTALTLPLGASFDAVQPAGSGLLVSGAPLRGGGCVWLSVDPASLASRRSRGSCVRPPRAAHAVVPVVTRSRRSQWQAVRIARPGAPVADGPVVAGSGAQALYEVTPEGRRARVVHREGRAALWLAAHAHTIWVEIVSGASRAPSGASTARGARDAAPPHDDRLRAGSDVRWRQPVGGDAGLGRSRLRAVHVRDGRRDRSLHGRGTPVATVPATGFCSLLLDPQGLTFAGGALFFLDGPRLHRVRPR